MKLITLILITTALNVSANVYSQYAKITVNISNGTLEDVFKAIETQTDFNIFYNVDQVNLKQKVSVEAKEELVSEVLDKVLSDAGASYTVLEKTIVIKAKESKLLSTKIKGIITSSDDGQPLIGATVLVKGTKSATVTDIDGKFEINVDQADSILVISYVGYTTQSVPLSGRTSVDIIMSPELHALDEVVVIGYGTIKKKDLTGAVSVVKSDQLKAEGTNTSLKSLQGMMAGVTIESAGGSPGSGDRVLIRGTSTINGNPNPLYVVDGVPVDNIDNIPSSEIESIDVLKDASAAAIYGSRGSTGVVLVTTKTGKKGENKIEFKATYGIQQLPKKMSVLNAKQWALTNDSARAADKIKFIPSASNADTLGAGTDYQDQIYRIGIVQQYDVSLSGGGDNYDYGASTGYFDQQGIVKQTDYERFNIRIKSDYTKKHLKVGESILFSNEKYLRIPSEWGQGGNPVSGAVKMVPLFGVYCDTCMGGYNGVTGEYGEVANPVAALNLTKNRDEYDNIVIDLYAELELIKNLKYKYNVGYKKLFSYNIYQSVPYQLGNNQLFVDSFSTMSETRAQTNDLLQEHTLNYNKEIGKHSINALAGFTFQTDNYRSLYGAGQDMAGGLSVLSAAQKSITSNSSETDWAMVSYLGRIVYDYDNRYLLTASIRRDGSSKFGATNRFGNFPSIALGWNVTNESFFKPLSGYINNLKLRFSYGELGNENIPDYLYSTTLSPNFNYVSGPGNSGQLWNGSIQTNYASKDIKWEDCKTTNFGADIGLFKNKLTLTADYYIKVNSDLLMQLPIPLSTGATNNPWVNFGQITNKGIELAVNFKDNIGKLSYSVYGTLTSIKNNVDEMGTATQQIIDGQPNQNGTGVTITEAGYPVGSFYLIQTAGIFKSQAEINSYIAIDSLGKPILNSSGKNILLQPNAKPGDIKFVDANKDGVINQEDRVVCGSPTPKLEYSFGFNLEWKGIDMSMYFQGVYGNKIYNGLKMDLVRMIQNWNYSTAVLDHWTPANPNSSEPRLTYLDKNQNDQVSSRFLEDGSYLRIKTLQIGYTIPKSWTTKAGIDQLRFFVSVDNLYTFTNYSGFNPDLGRDSNSWRDDLLSRGVDNGQVAYPLARTITGGIQLTF